MKKKTFETLTFFIVTVLIFFLLERLGVKVNIFTGFAFGATCGGIVTFIINIIWKAKKEGASLFRKPNEADTRRFAYIFVLVLVLFVLGILINGLFMLAGLILLLILFTLINNKVIKDKQTKEKISIATQQPASTPVSSIIHPQPKNEDNIYQKGIYILAFFAVSFIVAYFYPNIINLFSGMGVHVTEVIYHYHDIKTGYRWTYSPPSGSSFNTAINATENITSTFTLNFTCSMTILQAYATTPGFTFYFHDMPITFEPGQATTYTGTIGTPPHKYSGPLNINLSITYGSGCQ